MTPPSNTISEHALRRAAQIWGDSTAVWDCVAPSWLAHILSCPEPEPEPTSAAAYAALVEAHAALARPDFHRVHPSWIRRALRGESQAIVRTLRDHAPEIVVESLTEFSAPGPTLTPHPEIVACVLALWSERLVGGQPDPTLDSPVATVLTGPERTDLVGLLRLIPLVKRAYLPEAPEEPSWSHLTRKRFRAFQFAWGTDRDAELLEHARRDLAESATDATGRLPLGGLVTLARLLDGTDAHRLRWVLQHLPYQVARFVRGHMGAAEESVANTALQAWEDQVFALTRDRLRLERDQEDPW